MPQFGYWLGVCAVETFFASLTRRRLQCGAFHSLIDLQAAINRYLGEHNRKPSPDFSQRVDFRVAEREGTGEHMKKAAVVG